MVLLEDRRDIESFDMPNRLQLSGISSSEPPATPEAPQAESAATMDNNNAVAMSTWIPSVCVAASVSTVIVMAAPPMLIVAPSGIDTA